MESVKIAESKDISGVRCIICDSVGKWKNVDQFRYKPQRMHMCELCGFVTYPDVALNQDKLKDHYKEDYRTPPTANNLFSSERKLHYHINFLQPLLDKWLQEKKQPVILEIGSALGLFLNWFRGRFPTADINGTELTKSFVRTAFWIYKIILKDDADWSKKYDLIMTYKVAEHQPDIDKQLEKYRDSLSEDGVLYISVPTWFGAMTNFGMSGFSLEYYYDKNHVNVWSKNLFESLLVKKGFEVVDRNHSMYDDTYLCKVSKESNKTVQLDNPETRLKDLDKIYQAARLFDESKYSEAISVWSRFPQAHMDNYEMNRKKAHELGWDGIFQKHLKPALDSCPDNPGITLFVGDICMRYSRWDEAIEWFDKTLRLRPADVPALRSIANCLRQKALQATTLREKAHMFQNSFGVEASVERSSLQNRYDAMTWMMNDAANLPTPHEPEGKGLYTEEKRP